MNLHSKKARIPIAALGVTALCTAGLGVMAGSAFAQSTLTMTPTTTSVNMLDTGAVIGSSGHTAGSFDITSPTTASTAAATALANTTYAMRISSTNDNLKVSLDSYTTPTGTAPSAVTNALYYKATATDTAPVSGYTGISSSATLPVPGSAFNTNATSTPYVYLAPTQPGVYKVHVVDTQGTTATDDDVSSSTVTLTVKDVENVTNADTTDDWSPSVVNNSSSVGIGAPITTTVGLSSLTLIDGRGSSSAKGVLGDAIANLTAVIDRDATPTTLQTYTKISNPAGTVLLPVATTTGSTASPVTSTAVFDSDGDGTFTPTSTTTVFPNALALGSFATTVTTNNVTAVTAPAATVVSGSVAQASAGAAVSIKPGTAAVTYSATVTDTDTDKSGNVVYWTLTGTATEVAVLSTDGTAVDTTSSTTQKVFSSVTNSLGVATLTVTSGTTTAATTYTVKAQSNGFPASPTTVNATYAASALSSSLGSLMSANTSAEINPVAAAGVSVVLKGKAVDQYGAPFTPASSGTQTVTVAVNGTTTCNAVIASDGTFSCTYTPTTTPASGTTVPYTYTYNGATYSGSINFASAATAATVTLTTPANNGTATAIKASNTLASQPGVAVVGKVLDANNAGLAYKQVTLTGSGVKFSTVASPTTTSSTDDLADSLTTTTDSSGNIQGAYVFYVGTGSANVTATAGTATVTSTVTVAAPTVPDPFKVTVNDVSGKPGSTLIVTGTVTDGFGNPSPNAKVQLSTGTSTLGALGNTTPTTNSLGVFSTTFVTGSNQSGTADLTATLYDGTGSTLLTSSTNPTASTTFKNNGGLTIAAGSYTASAKVTLAGQEVTIAATGTLTGGGKAQLAGTADPNVTVEIWKKASGDSSFALLGNVQADADGAWAIGTSISKTTSWFARSGAISSSTVATVVVSTQSVKAKALGKGKVQFTVLGSPNVTGYVNVYYKGVRIGHVKSDSHGDKTVVVQSSAGKKTFQIYFAAPGTTLKATNLTGTVK